MNVRESVRKHLKDSGNELSLEEMREFDGKSVKEIIQEYLESRGLEGLVRSDQECACATPKAGIVNGPEGGFMPCNFCSAECKVRHDVTFGRHKFYTSATEAFKPTSHLHSHMMILFEGYIDRKLTTDEKELLEQWDDYS